MGSCKTTSFVRVFVCVVFCLVCVLGTGSGSGSFVGLGDSKAAVLDVETLAQDE